MATRRNRRRGKRTRRGGNWLTQKLRNMGIYDAGPSTSKLATAIHMLFDPEIDLSHKEKIKQLKLYLESNVDVDQGNLIEELLKKGIKKSSKLMNEIEAVLQDTLPQDDTRQHT